MSRARAATTGRPSLAAEPSPAAAPARGGEPPGPAPEPASDSRPSEVAAAPGTPTAAVERRTIQIGERPGPARPAPVSLQPEARPPSLLESWAPRIAAIVALIIVVAVLVLLLS
jgi:hypothetical protein